jgi:hypothetical protein
MYDESRALSLISGSGRWFGIVRDFLLGIGKESKSAEVQWLRERAALSTNVQRQLPNVGRHFISNIVTDRRIALLK